MFRVYRCSNFHAPAKVVRGMVWPKYSDGILTVHLTEKDDGFPIEDEARDIEYTVIGTSDGPSYLVTYDKRLVHSLRDEFKRPEISLEYRIVITDSVFGIPIANIREILENDKASNGNARETTTVEGFFVVRVEAPIERLRAMVYFYLTYGDDYERDLGLDVHFDSAAI